MIWKFAPVADLKSSAARFCVLPMAMVKAPPMGHYATDDVPFPIAKVDEEANSKKLPILEYNPQAAEQAWKRTMAFLDRHLKK